MSALLGGAGGQPFSAAGRRPLAPVAGFGTALLSSGGIGGRARSLAGPLEAVSFCPVGGLSPRRSWRARRRTGHRSPSSGSCPRPDTAAGRRPAEPHSGTGHHRDHPRRRLRERGIGRRIARKAAGSPARPGRPLCTIECTASGPAAASATAANARPSAPPRPPPPPAS
ncbi:hypothetical protein GCM10009605_33280 [Nocardiopsis composta]